MRIPLLRGRVFTGQDAATEGVILINEQMARGQWPNSDPIGRRTRLGDGESAEVTIVGVVGNVRKTGLNGGFGPLAYRLYLQAPSPRMSLVVRSELDPAGLTEAVRRAVWAVDKDQSITDTKTMEQRIWDSLKEYRSQMQLSIALAAVALLLAAGAWYGAVVSRPRRGVRQHAGRPNAPSRVTISGDRRVVVMTTSYAGQEAAEQVLATDPDSSERLRAATALGKTDSPQVVPALRKALSTDEDKYVRAGCAGYLGSIKGVEAERALLEAMADPEPYVRAKVVEALFRIGTQAARESIEGALKDADPDVRAAAARYAPKATKKVQKRLCPFLSEAGMCEPPGVSDLHECSWETAGRGRYSECFVYRMHTHPGGPGDFIRRNM